MPSFGPTASRNISPTVWCSGWTAISTRNSCRAPSRDRMTRRSSGRRGCGPVWARTRPARRRASPGDRVSDVRRRSMAAPCHPRPQRPSCPSPRRPPSRHASFGAWPPSDTPAHPSSTSPMRKPARLTGRRSCCCTASPTPRAPMTPWCRSSPRPGGAAWCRFCVATGRRASSRPTRRVPASRRRSGKTCCISWTRSASRARCSRDTIGAGARPAWWPPFGRSVAPAWSPAPATTSRTSPRPCGRSMPSRSTGSGTSTTSIPSAAGPGWRQTGAGSPGCCGACGRRTGPSARRPSLKARRPSTTRISWRW